MNKITFILLSLLLVGITYIDAVTKRDHNDYTKKPYRVVCYYGSWSHYHKIDPYNVEDIDPNLCTHLIYAFATVNDSTLEIQLFDHYLDGKGTNELKGYERFNNLRKKNPSLTTLIALGGWNDGSIKYSDMARDVRRRSNFVKSVVKFLTDYGFDGLDLDWEFPATRGGSPSLDQNDMSLLLKDLREAFDPLGFVLTAAVAAEKKLIDKAYHVPDLNKYVDWLHVMTYDYHGGWETKLGHNAPLYKRPDELDEESIWYNINFTINYYQLLGADKKKIVMGLPFFGSAYILADSSKVKPGDEAKGMAQPGFIGGEKGFLGYNEICIMTNNTDWTHTNDPYYKAPYAYSKQVWVGYDDTNSIACKASYLKQMGLSGAMIWSVEDDDFRNRCGGGVSPLLHKVNDMLNGAAKASFECKL